MEEHDFEHVEYVQCVKCGKQVDCWEYYNKDNDNDYGECDCSIKKEIEKGSLSGEKKNG